MLLDDLKYREWEDEYALGAVLKVKSDRTVTVEKDDLSEAMTLQLVNEYEPANKSLCVKTLDPGGEVTGQIHAEYDDTASSGTLFIYGFMVEEELRNHGIGKLLMNEMVKEANLRFPGAKLKLQVSTLSAAACHIYEQMGFLTESRLDYYAALEE